ncbi:MAG: hypothetical protein NTY76_07665 [Candidatus Omnitrophica bacterium]|nr:hypothetical protein [Candidatus Omnitrophota bacterium]
MLRGCIVILILTFGILIFSPSCPKDSLAQQNIRAVEGKIYAIDTFKSTVTVKSLMLAPVIKYSDVTLFVGPNTKIKRLGSDISIFDLTMGCPVNVQYADKVGTPEALSITVTK